MAACPCECDPCLIIILIIVGVCFSGKTLNRVGTFGVPVALHPLSEKEPKDPRISKPWLTVIAGCPLVGSRIPFVGDTEKVRSVYYFGVPITIVPILL